MSARESRVIAESDNGEPAYTPTTVVVTCEMVKVPVAFILLMAECQLGLMGTVAKVYSETVNQVTSGQEFDSFWRVHECHHPSLTSWSYTRFDHVESVNQI